MKNNDLVTVGKAASMLGVDVQTIRAWSDNGKLKCVVFPSGHRRILRIEIEKLLNKDEIDEFEKKIEKTNVIKNIVKRIEKIEEKIDE